MRKIFIDPGHGGEDSGAVGPSGYKEKQFSWELATILDLACKREGWETMWSRRGDINVSETASAQKANAWGADVFVSLHANAVSNPEVSGYEVLYWNTSENGLFLAEQVVSSFSEAFPDRKNRGVRPRSHGDRGESVLRKTSMPSIIVESEFLTNSGAETWLKKWGTQGKIVECLIESLQALFNKE